MVAMAWDCGLGGFRIWFVVFGVLGFGLLGLPFWVCGVVVLVGMFGGFTSIVF